MTSIGAQMRDMRERAGLRQKDVVAGFAGVDVPLLSKIEAGLVLPSESLYKHVCAACGAEAQQGEGERLKSFANGLYPILCRGESIKSMDAASRRVAILIALGDGPSTARRLAYKLGYAERNAVAPRLTELCEKGLVEPVGKERCEVTGKKVTIWARTY